MTLDDTVDESFSNGCIKNNRLFYGRDKKQKDQKVFRYLVKLEDLRKAELSLEYQRINISTEARRTIFGGLQLMKNEVTPRLKDVTIEANFSRKDYEIIKKYISESV